MSRFIVTPYVKEDHKFALFSVNSSFGIAEEKSFRSVEEAKQYPLVQQMFYLPFVQSVRLLDDALEIERFDILDWKDVIHEVAQEIEKYLNNGGKVIEAVAAKKIPVTVYAESTPNPSVMKFVANKMLVENTYEYKNISETSNAPIAKALFDFNFIKEIFLDANYISINKDEPFLGTKWLWRYESLFVRISNQERPLFLPTNSLKMRSPLVQPQSKN